MRDQLAGKDLIERYSNILSFRTDKGIQTDVEESKVEASMQVNTKPFFSFKRRKKWSISETPRNGNRSVDNDKFIAIRLKQVTLDDISIYNTNITDKQQMDEVPINNIKAKLELSEMSNGDITLERKPSLYTNKAFNFYQINKMLKNELHNDAIPEHKNDNDLTEFLDKDEDKVLGKSVGESLLGDLEEVAPN